MAFDFPAAPADGTEFTPVGGPTYVYKAPVWLLKPGRIILTADLTLYVRLDGADINDGLTNDAAGAFLTRQAAVEHLANAYDMQGFTATIQVADGTYTDAANYGEECVNLNGPVIIQGNVAAPASCQILSAGTCFEVSAPVKIKVQGFHLAASAASALRTSHEGGQIQFDKIEFGPCAQAHIFAQPGKITITPGGGSYSIVGGAQYHVVAGTHGIAFLELSTVTIVGTPAFSWAYMFAQGGFLYAVPYAYTGNVTGIKFIVSNGGQIVAGLVDYTITDIDYLPGDKIGSIEGNGAYNLVTNKEVLINTRTYYVSPTGNDLNSGLSPAQAIATIDQAILHVGGVEMNRQQVVIQLADGTYGAASVDVMSGQTVASNLIIRGNVAAPDNVQLAGQITVQRDSRVQFEGVTFAGAGVELFIPGGEVSLGAGVQFGPSTGIHVLIEDGGKLRSQAGYNILGGGSHHIWARNAATYSIESNTINLVGAGINFGAAFAVVQTAATILCANVIFTGIATGRRYLVDSGGMINTNDNAAGENYFPGDYPGEGSWSGVYMNGPSDRMFDRATTFRKFLGANTEVAGANYTPATEGFSNMRVVHTPAGAWTFNAPTGGVSGAECYEMILYLWNAAATGPITYAGFTKVDGAPSLLVGGASFARIVRIGGIVHLKFDVMAGLLAGDPPAPPPVVYKAYVGDTP